MKAWIWLLLSAGAVAISWSYMHRVLLPWEYSVNVQYLNLRSQMEDLYPRWVGARALLLQGKNPYGPEVTHEIQESFYGHDVKQDYQSGTSITDEQRFAYPIYVVFLLAPTVHLQFQTVQAAAPIVLLMAFAGSVLLWMEMLRWRPPVLTTLALTLALVASPQIVQGLRLRQLGLLVVFFFALGSWLVVRDRLASAGAVFAIATIKPQMVVLPLAWFLIWVIGDLQRRWRLLASFLISLALLTAAGAWFVPGWLVDFSKGLAAYRKYGPVKTLLQLVLGDGLGTALGVLLVVAVVLYGWAKRNIDATSTEFPEVAGVFLIVAGVALPLMTQFNQALLVPAALMIVRDWKTVPKAAQIIFRVIVFWPWVVALTLLSVPLKLDPLNHLPLLPSIFVLFFPFLLPVLLTVRRRDVSAQPDNAFADG